MTLCSAILQKIYLDVDIVLKKGDIVASCRLEKPENPEDAEFETYTMVKNKKDLENAKKQDDLLRELCTDPVIKPKKKKKTKKSKNKPEKEKKKKKEKKTKEKPQVELSFDFDALDFEPINSEEEEEPEENGDNGEPTSDVSLSDMSEGEEGLENEAEEEEEDDVEFPDEIEPTSKFYSIPFQGLLHQVGGGLKLKGGAKSMAKLRIQPTKGYTAEHMFGRKCCIALNESLTAPDKFKDKTFNVLPRIETVKKSSENFPIVNAFVENTTKGLIFYPNDTVLGTARFISGSVDIAEVSLPSAPPVQVDRGPTLTVHKF